MHLDEFAAELAQVRSLDEQTKVLEEGLRPFGYDSYLFGVLPVPDAEVVRDLIMKTNFDEKWVKEYTERRYYQFDNSAEHCMLNNTPILWSNLDHEGLSDKQREVIERATFWGYTVGVSIPLSSPFNSLRFGISFAIRGETDFGLHDEMFRQRGQAVVALARQFFASANLLEQVINHYRLTPEDIRVISLLIAGKKAVEIADMVAKDEARKLKKAPRVIPEHDINNHTKSIRAKVNVRTTNELIALFSRLGI